MTTKDLMKNIIDDLSTTLQQVDVEQIDALRQAIIDADRIFIAGKGRTGLQMKGFAMRLMHLGLRVHVIDEVTTPAIQSGDLLIIGSGSGRTASLMRYAETVGQRSASLAAITGNPSSTIAAAAQTVVHIPATNFKSDNHNQKQSVFVMGSLFEHTLGLVCDLLIIQLMRALNQTEIEMNARHANLE